VVFRTLNYFTDLSSIKLVNFDNGLFRLALLALSLSGLDADFFRLVSRNKARISETVKQVLLANIVRVEEAFSDRDKADKNSSCWAFLIFNRFQWCADSRAFHDGNRPGTISVNDALGESLVGIWVSFKDLLAGRHIWFSVR